MKKRAGIHDLLRVVRVDCLVRIHESKGIFEDLHEVEEHAHHEDDSDSFEPGRHRQCKTGGGHSHRDEDGQPEKCLSAASPGA